MNCRAISNINRDGWKNYPYFFIKHKISIEMVSKSSKCDYLLILKPCTSILYIKVIKNNTRTILFGFASNTWNKFGEWIWNFHKTSQNYLIREISENHQQTVIIYFSYLGLPSCMWKMMFYQSYYPIKLNIVFILVFYPSWMSNYSFGWK